MQCNNLERYTCSFPRPLCKKWFVILELTCNKRHAYYARVTREGQTYLEAMGKLTRQAPEVHWCSLHNCEESDNFRKFLIIWRDLQLRVSTFSEEVALRVKMGEPGTWGILLTEGLTLARGVRVPVCAYNIVFRQVACSFREITAAPKCWNRSDLMKIDDQ